MNSNETVAVGLDGASGIDGGLGDVVEGDRLALERAPVVQAGKEEQVLDQKAHAGALVLDRAHDVDEIFRTLACTAAKQFRVTTDRRQRGS